MLERRTQAIMDKMDGLLGNRRGSRNRGAHSREASREPRVNFKEHPNRGRTYGSTRGRGYSYSNDTGSQRPRNPTNIRGSSSGSRPISNEKPTREAQVVGRGDSTNWSHSNQRRAQPSDSDGRVNQQISLKFRSLKQQIRTIKRDIHGMQQQWPQRSSP